jgi:hypothetical protein
MAPRMKDSSGPAKKRPVAKAPAGRKTGESKLREENKRLRAEVRGLKKGAAGDDKKASGPKESMKDKMARLRGMVGKKKK